MDNKLTELHKIAEKEKIPIYYLRINNKNGVSVLLNKNHTIGLKNNLSNYQEQETLAHELGHCLTGSLYYVTDINNPCYRSNIGWAERKANNWAIKTLVPLPELKTALIKVHNSYSDEPYFVAEMLGLSIEQVNYAINYYKRKNLL